jgi:hypothetical protein
MIDLRSEELVALAEAGRHVPGRPHLSTIFRWAQKGVRGGVRLETVVVGGRRFTSVEAICRFVAALSRRPASNKQEDGTPVEKHLEALGF